MAYKYEAKAFILAWELIDKLDDITGKTFDTHSLKKYGIKDTKGFRVFDDTFRTSFDVTGSTWSDVCDSAMAALAVCNVIESSINESKEG